MNTSLRDPEKPHALLYAWGFVGLFVVAYWFGLLDSPLVRAPQLDSAELLELARRIVAGNLPPEPFYRAMGYTLVLATAAFVGLSSTAALGIFAVTLGAFLHLMNTGLVASLAARVWRSQEVRPWAVALFGLNPVLLFFSLDVLDVALGLTCALAGLRGLTASGERKGLFLWGALLVGLAGVVRPHFLFLFPLILGWLLFRAARERRWFAPLGGIALLALPLLAQATWGWRVSGEFQLFPWQGAYNLYAANAPGANGKYFKQSVVVSDRPEFVNPARIESEYRYQEQTGAERPLEVSAMNSYWRSRFFGELAREPGSWLALMGRKLYYLFNDFEQYNNKTFAFYRDKRLLLHWDPLTWGVLLILATGVGLAASAERRRALGCVFLVAAFYAIGVLAFYVSGRFRLPLHAALVVVGAGLPVVLPGLSVRRIRVAAIGMAVVGLLTFSRFLSVDATDTFVQDRMLLANAAATVGDDAVAEAEARAVWEAHPQRHDAQRIALLSFFNRQLGLIEGGKDPDWKAGETLLFPLPPTLSRDVSLSFAVGVVRWNLGQHEEALELWNTTAINIALPPGAPIRTALEWIRGNHRFDPSTAEFWARLLPLSPPDSDV